MDIIRPFSDDLSRLFPGAVAARDRHFLAVMRSTRGLRLEGGHGGTLRAGRRIARLEIEPGGWISVRLSIDTPPANCNPAHRSGELPGNLRYAAGRKGLALIAETRIDDIDHLPDSLAEIREGLAGASARRRAPCGGREDLPELEAVRAALDEARARLELEPAALIETRASIEAEGAWELRPRLEGPPVAVRITRERGGLRLAHRITGVPRTAGATAAVAAEALRWNVHIRFARIVATEEGFAVESRLRTAQVAGEWIALASRAVAVVTLHARAPLRLLASDARLSSAYEAVFSSRLDNQPLDPTEEVHTDAPHHDPGDLRSLEAAALPADAGDRGTESAAHRGPGGRSLPG